MDLKLSTMDRKFCVKIYDHFMHKMWQLGSKETMKNPNGLLEELMPFPTAVKYL